MFVFFNHLHFLGWLLILFLIILLQIVEIEMPFDRVKNQRKNFCFITYDNENVVFDLLKTPKQVINGKEVDVKKATPKPDSFGPPAMRGGRGGPGGMRGAPRGRGGK